jgi:heat shock protein HtpX
MALLLFYCGWIVAGWGGVRWAVFGAVVLCVLCSRAPSDLLVRAVGARPVTGETAKTLYATLAGLCRNAGLAQSPYLYLMVEQLPIAFTVGCDDRTTIVLSDGLIEALSLREIAAILAHELMHVRNHDMALTQWAIGVAAATRAVTQIGLLLIFVNIFLSGFRLSHFRFCRFWY